MRNIKGILLISILCLVFIFNIAGCGTIKMARISESPDKAIVQKMEPGDEVLVDFTCRLKHGGIVMTTNPEAVNDNNIKKSGVFLPLREYKPIPVIAAGERKGPDHGKMRGLRDEILEAISTVIPGMELGSTGTFEIASQIMPGLTEEDRYKKKSRIKKTLKHSTIHPRILESLQGKAPVPGDIIIPKDDEQVSFKVMSVTENEARVSISMKEGMKRDMSFGSGTVRDAGDHYDIVLDIHEGQLIRSGEIIGRITDVGEKTYTIDYGHPFGHETLSCDVSVKNITSDENNQGD